MILYLSGPMRGHLSFNFPTFDAVAKSLRSQGFGVLSPAEHDRETYPDIEQWEGFESGSEEQCPQFVLSNSLAWDFQAITDSDGIALMPGWEGSRGSRAERFVAECIGKPIYRVVPVDAGGYTLIRDSRIVMLCPEVAEAPARKERVG